MLVNQLLGEFTLDEFRSDFEFMDLVVHSVRSVRLPLRSLDRMGLPYARHYPHCSIRDAI